LSIPSLDVEAEEPSLATFWKEHGPWIEYVKIQLGGFSLSSMDPEFIRISWKVVKKKQTK